MTTTATAALVTASEARWPSVLAVLAAIGLYLSAPETMMPDAGAATAPLTAKAKLLMLLQSSISIVTLILVAARAVNMLG